MIKSYFLSSWRNLLKNKFYSLLNITGLTVGLAVGMLILLWVQDEKSFDAWHSQASSIYRLENRVGTGGSKQIWEATVAPIGPLAKNELPEVRDAVRLTGVYNYLLFSYGDKSFEEDRMAYTDPSFFKIFDFPLVRGNSNNPFPDIHSVVLTASTARKYFGDEDPIGKTLVGDRKAPFKVTGIIADIPRRSSLKVEMLFPMALMESTMYTEKDHHTMMTDFGQFNYDTYLLLRPGARPDGLTARLNAIHLRNKPDDTDLEYLLQPLADMHLYRADGSDGGIGTVRMFMLVSILILAIACINNVNLSTARSLLRAKEVSLRKIVGAGRLQLFIQFMVEAVLLFAFATVLALGLMKALMPFFNQVSGKALSLDLRDLHVWSVILLTVSATLLASGIYPAVLLSAFRPLEALRGRVRAGVGNGLYRRVLVVVQFVFSMLLIVGTLVIGRQLNYIHSRQLGYDKEHVFSFYLRTGMVSHYEALKADLMRSPGVEGVARGNSSIVRLGPQTGDNEWDGKAPGQTMMVHPVAIDKDFIPFFKMQLAKGSNFTDAAADSTHFILNEAAVKETGIRDPIGKPFRMWQTRGTIVGVIKDFHFASMRQKIGPAVFYYQPHDSRLVYVRTKPGESEKAIAAAAGQWKQYGQGYAFKYNFLDEQFDAMYASEQRTGVLSKIFSIIAILISCLGLLGLATYTAQVRTREIGVRKVLGASVADILRLLGTDFMKLVLLGIIMAAPLAWYLMTRWLEDFAYKVRLHWSLFALAGFIGMAVALLTISFQAVRAAVANPVKSLRSE